MMPDLKSQYGRLVSYSLPCEGISIATFLRQAKGNQRFYWESSRDKITFVGFGAAAELMAWGEDRFNIIQQQAKELFQGSVILNESESLAAPRLFGGVSFSSDFVPDNTWTAFYPAHFILPHYQLVSIDGQKWLTINAQLPFEENPHDLLPELREALLARIDELTQLSNEPSNNPLSAMDINFPMPYETWKQNIENATSEIKSGKMKKVVLSRIAEIRFAERIDVDSALKYLALNYSECYRFLFEPRPYHAFYGATPELLAQVSGDKVITMGLAGSIRRGKTPEEDIELEAQFLSDPKERHEHELVVSKIRERLEQITTELQIAPIGIYKLSNIQHLFTPIRGVLKEALGVLSVVEILHPTPALGGEPRQQAIQFINENEPVPRGWYGAPVGWIDRNLDGQFGVAIRSAIAQDKRVWMYAGAGIVADSVPEKEWNETALKFRPMLDALGIGELIDV